MKRSNALVMGWLAALAVAGLAMPGSLCAMPLLSEVYYDAPGSDDGWVFVEIFGAPGASLDGYFVDGINGSNGVAGPTIELSGTIGGSGLFVLADSTSTGATFVEMADLHANFDFQNGPDSIRLRRGDLVLDAVGYGVFGVGEVFAGEGAAAPDGAAGESLARRFANLDTGDNASDFVLLSEPTPGVASFSAVPEPSSAMLIGLGLAALSRGRGRCLSGTRVAGAAG